jgi:hypothetical protein
VEKYQKMLLLSFSHHLEAANTIPEITALVCVNIHNSAHICCLYCIFISFFRPAFVRTHSNFNRPESGKKCMASSKRKALLAKIRPSYQNAKISLSEGTLFGTNNARPILSVEELARVLYTTVQRNALLRRISGIKTPAAATAKPTDAERTQWANYLLDHFSPPTPLSAGDMELIQKSQTDETIPAHVFFNDRDLPPCKCVGAAANHNQCCEVPLIPYVHNWLGIGSLTRPTFQTLKGSDFCVDDVITVSMKLLEIRYPQDRFFDTAVYNIMHTEPEFSLLIGPDLSRIERFFLPVNVPGHFILLVADVATNTISVYDSLNSTAYDQYVANFARTLTNSNIGRDWHTKYVPVAPQRENECAISVSFIAQAVAAGIPAIEANWTNGRNYIAARMIYTDQRRMRSIHLGGGGESNEAENVDGFVLHSDGGVSTGCGTNYNVWIKSASKPYRIHGGATFSVPAPGARVLHVQNLHTSRSARGRGFARILTLSGLQLAAKLDIPYVVALTKNSTRAPVFADFNFQISAGSNAMYTCTKSRATQQAMRGVEHQLVTKELPLPRSVA